MILLKLGIKGLRVKLLIALYEFFWAELGTHILVPKKWVGHSVGRIKNV